MNPSLKHRLSRQVSAQGDELHHPQGALIIEGRIDRIDDFPDRHQTIKEIGAWVGIVFRIALGRSTCIDDDKQDLLRQQRRSGCGCSVQSRRVRQGRTSGVVQRATGELAGSYHLFRADAGERTPGREPLQHSGNGYQREMIANPSIGQVNVSVFIARQRAAEVPDGQVVEHAGISARRHNCL